MQFMVDGPLNISDETDMTSLLFDLTYQAEQAYYEELLQIVKFVLLAAQNSKMIKS